MTRRPFHSTTFHSTRYGARIARRLCVDCGSDTKKFSEYYSVTNKIWADAGMRADGGQLCIGCLEVRLGRKLYRPDFLKCHSTMPG
jgi:hypothetical protein